MEPKQAFTMRKRTAQRAEEKDGATGGSLRLDFDFKGGSGYAIARRPIQLRLPEDYRFSLQVRGQGTIMELVRNARTCY